MPITRAQIQKELTPGLNALFGLEYKQYPEEHKMIFDVESSERAWEEEQKLVGFGAAQVKAEGEGVAFDTARESYLARYTHETIALAFAITEEAIEDNLYTPLSKRYVKALARAVAYTKQIKAASIINNAFNGAVVYGDGVSLCSTAHPNLQAAPNANTFTTAVDLNETSLEAAINQMALWTDERGILLAARPKRLLIPAALQFTATRLLNSEQRPGTADNDINALRNNGAVPDGFAVNHYFTDPDAWFLKTDIPDGLKHFVRAAVKQTMDEDFNTGNLMYKVRERYSFGVSDPLGIFGSAGA